MYPKHEEDHMPARRNVSNEERSKMGNNKDYCSLKRRAWGRSLVSSTCLNEMRPSRRSELWHPRGKWQRIIGVFGTPNANRPPHSLLPRDLEGTWALNGGWRKFFDELQLENVLALLPTFSPFVCVYHLPTKIRAAPEAHDFLDGVCPRGH